MTRRVINNKDMFAAQIEPAYFYSAVCHASTQVESVSWNEQRNAFTIDFNGSEQELDRLIHLLKQKIGRAVVNHVPEAIYVHEVDRACEMREVWEDLSRGGMIKDFGEGHVALSGLFLDLVEQFDSALKEIAAHLDAKPMQLPNMIPLTYLKQIGAFEHHPQQLFFATPIVSDIETIERFQTEARSDNPGIQGYLANPGYCLKTSACSLLYPMLNGTAFQRPSYFTVLGACTRHEAKGTNLFERLTEFSMREIVFVGDESGAEEFQRLSINLFRDLIECFNLNGRISKANDSFFISNYSRYRLMQLLGSEKFELQFLPTNTNEGIAVGSFNHHRRFFSQRFGLSYCGTPAVTACLGFGLERLVYSVFCQHGVQSPDLPAMMDQFRQHRSIQRESAP